MSKQEVQFLDDKSVNFVSGSPGFLHLQYKGEEFKASVTGEVYTIFMCKNDPDKLDMRYKANRKFLERLKG